MPQMAPMYWLFLFFYFLAIFLVYVMITYYFSLPVNKSVEGTEVKKLNYFSWSW